MLSIKELVHQFVTEIYSNRNLGYLKEILSDQFICETPEGIFKGLEEYTAMFRAVFDAFPDAKLTINEY